MAVSGIPGTLALSDVTPGTVAAEKVIIPDKNKGIDLIYGKSGSHLVISTNPTSSDDKNVRIGSRNIVQTSGSHSDAQIKPNQSVTGTASVVGLEVSPRFAAGIAGADLVAIKADPLLKAGTGNLSGKVAAVEANIDFGTSGTRTITGDVSAFESFLAIPSTYTYSGDISFLRVRAVNIKAWGQFLNLDDTATGVDTASDPSAATQDRWLKVMVGSTQYYLRMYTA